MVYRIAFSLLFFVTFASNTAFARKMPRVDGDWWTIALSPDMGAKTGSKQEPVDFAIWQAADGTWQLWSCIRGTNCGGFSRLFHRWEGRDITAPNWTPM